MGYLTRNDVNNFGSDLVDLAQRAALDATTPAINALQQENAALRERLADEAHRGLEQQLDRLLPNWRTINDDPRFHQWLVGTHEFSGLSKQQLLDSAVARGDVGRAIKFFQRFLEEQGAVGRASAGQATAPARRRALTTPDGRPIFTRAEITQRWKLRRQGRIGDEAWARWENELCRASAEGRIAGGLDKDGNPGAWRR